MLGIHGKGHREKLCAYGTVGALALVTGAALHLTMRWCPPATRGSAVSSSASSSPSGSVASTNLTSRPPAVTKTPAAAAPTRTPAPGSSQPQTPQLSKQPQTQQAQSTRAPAPHPTPTVKSMHTATPLPVPGVTPGAMSDALIPGARITTRNQAVQLIRQLERPNPDISYDAAQNKSGSFAVRDRSAALTKRGGDGYAGI